MMDMTRLIAIIIFAACVSPSVMADGIMPSIVEERHGLWRLAELPYKNPAVMQWRMSCGLTSVKAAYDMRDDRGEVNPSDGSSEWQASAGAETYTKYRNTTLWGHGFYTNGMKRDVRWNESSDFRLVYPYVLADSVGGDIKAERYSFGGGYAAVNGRLAWGVSMSYLATLEYRDVDPRPRNVVGCLDAAAGVAYNVWGSYFAGISVSFRKYKQSSDIEFKSEMGVDKVFHMTGLGTHYRRFAGTGLSTYYDGYRYGVSADLYPSSGRGVFLSCAVSRFSFDNILSDLNKLPLASAWHNELQAEAGWLGMGDRLYGGVSSAVRWYRRHGCENIFGDASAGMYPQIASNAMFADNFCSVSAQAEAGVRRGDVDRVSVNVNGGWQRQTIAYIEPWRYTLVNAADAGIAVAGDVKVCRDWLISCDGGVSVSSPFGCSSQFDGLGDDSEMNQAERMELGRYDLSSHCRFGSFASVGVARMVAGRYLVRLDGGWRRMSYHGGISSDMYSVALTFNF